MLGARLLDHVRKAANHLEQAGAQLPVHLPEADEAANEAELDVPGHFDPHDTDDEGE